MATVAGSDISPDRLTLTAFGGIVLIAGANFVAVRFSNQEVPPFLGAGVRFALAALLFLLVVALRRLPLPRGRELVGIVLYGLLGFTGFYALAYRALVELPAGIASVVAAAVPLLTLFFAVVQGVERFTWRGLLGGIITLVGIAILLNAPMTLEIPLLAMVSMLGAAACAAEAAVVIKRFPPSHPVVTNGLAMAIGTPPLFAISALAGETWSVPGRSSTWWALGYLVLLGSVGLFALFLFVLRRWTASGTSYQFVLIPVVAVLLGALLAGEPVSGVVLVGGLIVVAGVYVGALAHRRPPVPDRPASEALAQQNFSC